MGDSSPSTPELPERKNRLSSNSGIKRNKVSRACDECRKRKVRCDGAQPCARCQKATSECVFSNVTPRRGPPKQYLEPFETRLRSIDSALKVLELSSDRIQKDDLGVQWQAKDPVIEANACFDVTSIGQTLYTPDQIERPQISKQLHTEPSQPYLNINFTSTALRLDLIQSYFDHIHPSTPIISRDALADPQPPALLLNSIYAVSAKFIDNKQTKSKDPPGWGHYKAALSLIDIYLDTPRLTTIQALLLLAKYHEHIHRPGFFWRTKFFIQLAVKLSNNLRLCEEPPLGTGPNWEDEFELRRRTFWAVYTYEVLMSTEQGLQLQIPHAQCTAKYPHVLSDESSSDSNAVIDFHWLSKVIHVQAAVLQFLRQKYGEDSFDTEFEEFSTLEKNLIDLGDYIPPMSEESSTHSCFVHLIYHLATILLFRPYALAEENQTHLSHCISSASAITHIVDHRLKKEGLDCFYTVARGNQQIIYCLTAAVTIQRVCRYNYASHDTVNTNYEKTCLILQMLSGKSPVAELENVVHEVHHQQWPDRIDVHTPSNTSSTRSSPLIPALNSPHSPSLPAPTIRKRHSRSSLQFPSSDVNKVLQSSGNYVPEMVNHRMRPANRSPYANNRLSAPALGTMFQQSPYYLQLQQQQQQQQHQQMQQHMQQHQRQQISSHSQPSSPTASQFGSNDYTGNMMNNSNTFPTPRHTGSISRKTGLRRCASSTGEFIVPSQQQRANRNPGPYVNPRRHTLTNSTPPDLTIPIATPSSVPTVIIPPSPRNLHAMATGNHRYSAPVMSNTHLPYTIPITQQQQHYQQQNIMLDPSFPLDPVIPDSPNESMIGLLLNPWDFSQPPPQ